MQYVEKKLLVLKSFCFSTTFRQTKIFVDISECSLLCDFILANILI